MSRRATQVRNDRIAGRALLRMERTDAGRNQIAAMPTRTWKRLDKGDRRTVNRANGGR